MIIMLIFLAPGMSNHHSPLKAWGTYVTANPYFLCASYSIPSGRYLRDTSESVKFLPPVLEKAADVVVPSLTSLFKKIY